MIKSALLIGGALGLYSLLKQTPKLSKIKDKLIGTGTIKQTPNLSEFNGIFDEIELTKFEITESKKLTEELKDKLKKGLYVPLRGYESKSLKPFMDFNNLVLNVFGSNIDKNKYKNDSSRYFKDNFTNYSVNRGHDYCIFKIQNISSGNSYIVRVPFVSTSITNADMDNKKRERIKKMIEYAKFMSDNKLGAEILGTDGNIMLMKEYHAVDYILEISLQTFGESGAKNLVKKMVDVIEKQYLLGYVSRDNKPDNFVFENDDVFAIDFDDCFKIGDTIEYNNTDTIINKNILFDFFISQLLQLLLTISYSMFKSVKKIPPPPNTKSVPEKLEPIFSILDRYGINLENIPKYTIKNGLHHISYYTKHLDNEILSNIKPFEQIYQLKKYL